MSTSGPSESKEDSPCRAFIAATGDKLGLGKHISCAIALSIADSCDGKSDCCSAISSDVPSEAWPTESESDFPLASVCVEGTEVRLGLVEEVEGPELAEMGDLRSVSFRGMAMLCILCLGAELSSPPTLCSASGVARPTGERLVDVEAP